MYFCFSTTMHSKMSAAAIAISITRTSRFETTKEKAATNISDALKKLNVAIIQLYVARATVWQAFIRLQDWPQWNTEIVAAAWVHGDPWLEGSTFELRHRSLLGTETTTSALLRLVAPGMSAVWESAALGIHVVNSAHLKDNLGGCKLTAKHSYRGIGAAGLRLIKGRQQAKLDTAMQELKRYCERGVAS